MRGVPAEDPSCIHNIDELERRVEEIGFLGSSGVPVGKIRGRNAR